MKSSAKCFTKPYGVKRNIALTGEPALEVYIYILKKNSYKNNFNKMGCYKED